MNVTGPRERATFTLSPATRRKLDLFVAKSERSRFVEEAVEQALDIEARRKAVEAIRDFPRVANPAGDSTDVLREMRSDRDAYLGARQRGSGQ
ncbi:MAG: hypothetical protein IPL47_05065 [Phyllobacteriaceae bacterium]|nr:hypothetical protein [Phyllobacteriaceae bacterium]